VRVAAGDYDSDGLADIIVAAGPGGGPHVRVLKGTNLAELDSFFAYSADFRGGVFVSAADLNADGRADILTGAGFSGAAHLRIRDAATGNDLASFYGFTPLLGGSTPFSDDSVWQSGVNGVAFADNDLDGLIDVIVGSGTGQQSRARVFRNRGTGANPAFDAQVFDDIFFDPQFREGVQVGGASAF
jgi:hypothetical protein